MYCEWPITLNCVIITALLFPFIVISAVIVVICVMTVTPICCEQTVCLCSARVGFSFFNEIYEKKKMPIWDEGGLFVVFIKGEDVRGRCEKKNERERNMKVTTANVDSRSGGMTFTAKRPWIIYFWSRSKYFIANLFWNYW